MIWESSFWKDDLLVLADKIKRKYQVTAFSEEIAVEFEKDIMLALYSVRKLEETGKLSSNTKGYQIEVESYKNIKNVTKLNWHHIDELYTLDIPIVEKIGADKLYNQIIHSYIFLISTDESEFINGFYFCSDRMRNNKLYFITLTELKRFITYIGNDYPTKLKYDYDESIKDYKVHSET
ncbi:hypothetical protein [Paenibacillus lautus]|uniref:hypothetical protein n=1 Tax=Paenibacillus lautus TaxID=1401 RepID=UPI003D26C432